ncbi:36722_t:CDS:1, partial [Gigaspora margarita]
YAVTVAGALKIIILLVKLYLLQLISKIEECVLKSNSVNPASIIQLTIIYKTLINSTLHSLDLR